MAAVPSLFSTFNISVYRALVTYLVSTPSNSAFNKKRIVYSKTDTHITNICIGASGNCLSLAFTWGSVSASTLKSFVLEIDVSGRSPGIGVIQAPVGFSPKKIADYARAVLAATMPAIHNKMVLKCIPLKPKKKKQGGSYQGVRLEAHQHTRTLPSNKFASHKDTFTDEFAKMATDLHITLK